MPRMSCLSATEPVRVSDVSTSSGAGLRKSDSTSSGLACLNKASISPGKARLKNCPRRLAEATGPMAEIMSCPARSIWYARVSPFLGRGTIRPVASNLPGCPRRLGSLTHSEDPRGTLVTCRSEECCDCRCWGGVSNGDRRVFGT